MVEVVLFLGPPNYSTRKFILLEKGVMGGFRKSHNNYTGTTTTPFLSTDYSVGADVV